MIVINFLWSRDLEFAEIALLLERHKAQQQIERKKRKKKRYLVELKILIPYSMKQSFDIWHGHEVKFILFLGQQQEN